MHPGHNHPLQPAAYRAQTRAPVLPARYVRLPIALLTRFVADPLAIALYALVGRCLALMRAPVPLSGADIARLDQTTTRGTVKHALDRLVDAGWLVATTRAGCTSSYTPTWGAAERPWVAGARSWAKPDRLATCALDVGLLDAYLGTLAPAATGPARIVRPAGGQLLSLTDVGSYALALGGWPGTTPRLSQLHLICDGQAAPLPAEPPAATHPISDPISDPITDPSAAAQQDAQPAGRSAQTPPPWIHDPHEESTNQPTASGGADRAPAVGIEPNDTHDQRDHDATTLALDPAVIAGHQALNPGLTLAPGEWHDLALLQQQHGAALLLIWQARAVGRAAGAPGRIRPGYYRACAAEAVRRPARARRRATPAPLASPDPTERAAPSAPPPDPERVALLQALGVRAIARLAHVPLALIQDWQAALAHRGMAQFRNPLAFAISQMIALIPPPLADLERWAAQQETSHARRTFGAPIPAALTSANYPGAFDYDSHLAAARAASAELLAEIGDAFGVSV